MKALRIIQVLAKIARVICVILFVFCIVGAAGCLIGLITLPLSENIVIFDGKTVVEFINEKGGSMSKAYGGIVAGLLSCGVGIFLSKYNELFFKEEIELGTPFKMNIVKKMRKVAIVNIIATVALSIAVGIAVVIIQAIYHEDINLDLNLFSTIGFGISLLIISLFCEYGAEKEEGNQQDPIS